MYGNHLSFRRDGGYKPYVSKLMVSAHDDGDVEAIAKLLEAGYTDIVNKELNEDAGGDYIYLGMKRTFDVNNAVYDLLLTNDVSTPPSSINGYKLVSSIDLNKDAGGKYIYLYEKRTPSFKGELPMYDILIGGEYHEDYYFESDGKRFSVKSTNNQDGEMQYVNQRAGGDYIYLLKVKESQHITLPELGTPVSHIGSILGSGSLLVIGIFLIAAAGAGGYVVYKKKHQSNKKD
jgi:hypothetical protein